MSPGIILLLFFINALISISYGLTCSAPVLGIGAILFRPQGMKVEPPQGGKLILHSHVEVRTKLMINPYLTDMPLFIYMCR